MQHKSNTGYHPIEYVSKVHKMRHISYHFRILAIEAWSSQSS